MVVPDELCEVVLRYSDELAEEQALIESANRIEETDNVELQRSYTPVVGLRHSVMPGPHHEPSLLKFYLPAIAVPYDQKKDFVCPGHHLHTLKNALEETTHLLVIGWRATEEPFIKLLKENSTRLESVVLVNGGLTGATEAADHLRAAGLTADWNHTPRTFTELVEVKLDGVVKGLG